LVALLLLATSLALLITIGGPTVLVVVLAAILLRQEFQPVIVQAVLFFAETISATAGIPTTDGVIIVGILAAVFARKRLQAFVGRRWRTIVPAAARLAVAIAGSVVVLIAVLLRQEFESVVVKSRRVVALALGRLGVPVGTLVLWIVAALPGRIRVAYPTLILLVTSSTVALGVLF
jgi:hypothetical protein